MEFRSNKSVVWPSLKPPSGFRHDQLDNAGGRRGGVGDHDMICVVGIVGDGKVASGDPLLADGEKRGDPVGRRGLPSWVWVGETAV